MEAYDALVAGDLHAPHVPEAFGGVGADALAFSIAVEATVAWISSLGRVPTGVNSLRLHSNPACCLDAHAAESLAQEQVSHRLALTCCPTPGLRAVGSIDAPHTAEPAREATTTLCEPAVEDRDLAHRALPPRWSSEAEWEAVASGCLLTGLRRARLWLSSAWGRTRGGFGQSTAPYACRVRKGRWWRRSRAPSVAA